MVTNIENEKFRERIWERWQKWGEKMQEAFDRETCGYFTPASPNDGDPAPEHNHKLGKARRIRARRAAEDNAASLDADSNYNDMTDEEWEKV